MGAEIMVVNQQTGAYAILIAKMDRALSLHHCTFFQSVCRGMRSRRPADGLVRMR